MFGSIKINTTFVFINIKQIMGYQTNYTKCKKCGQVIIKTKIQYLWIARNIITTKCTCNERNKNNKIND